MDENAKISPFELSVLTIFFSLGTTVLVIPSILVSESKQDAWISSLFSMIICAFLAYFYFICGKRLKGKSYIQYLCTVHGKILGKIIGSLYVFFSLFGVIALLSYLGYFITTQILPNTPMKILYLLLTVLMVFVVSSGLEVLARTGELLIGVVFLLYIALVVFLLPEIEVERAKPVFVANVTNHTRAILIFVSFSGFPLVVFLMIFPKHLNNLVKTKWSFITGTIIGTGMVVVMILLCIIVLGVTNTARQLYPSYALAKSVSLFGIIERIESVMATIWLVSIFFKGSVYFYACTVGLAQIVEAKSYRFLLVPIGLLSIIYTTVFYPDYEYMVIWDSNNWVAFSAIFGFVIPLFTLIVDIIKVSIRNRTINTNHQKEAK